MDHDTILLAILPTPSLWHYFTVLQLRMTAPLRYKIFHLPFFPLHSYIATSKIRSDLKNANEFKFSTCYKTETCHLKCKHPISYYLYVFSLCNLPRTLMFNLFQLVPRLFSVWWARWTLRSLPEQLPWHNWPDKTSRPPVSTSLFQMQQRTFQGRAAAFFTGSSPCILSGYPGIWSLIIWSIKWDKHHSPPQQL